MPWEYRTISFPVARGFFPFAAGGEVEADEVTRSLNTLGRQGWELVSALDTNDAGGQTRLVVCILKRPLGE